MSNDIHDVTELRVLHEQLRSGSFKGDVYQLIHRFGDAGFLEARATVERLLANEDSELRSIAVNVLVLHWGLTDYAEDCLRMAQCDADSEVRRTAAAAVGSLFGNTRSPEVLAFCVSC